MPNDSILNNTTVISLLPSAAAVAADRTGLFIGLFLLFLLFLLISYLFYSFLTFKRFHSEANPTSLPTVDDKQEQKIIFNDHDNLVNNDGEIIIARQNSFSDCGTSIRSSSIPSHINPQVKRSSSYRLCSQPSNYLLTPRVSSQWTTNNDECLSATIIVEPHDIHLANALSRSISKYYERQRKPRLKRRIHSYEDLMIHLHPNSKRSLQMTASLPMRNSSRPRAASTRTEHKQPSLKKKPTTIYELYKSDRMRISNLLVADP